MINEYESKHGAKSHAKKRGTPVKSTGYSYQFVSMLYYIEGNFIKHLEAYLAFRTLFEVKVAKKFSMTIYSYIKIVLLSAIVVLN